MPENKTYVEGLDFSHCLRPLATKLLAKKLLDKRTSVNLVGKPGMGKQRMLKDLEQLPIPGVKWVYMNMKVYVHSHGMFIQELGSKLGNQDPTDAPRLMGQMLTLENGSPERLCLMLDNYDAILDNPDVDHGFDQNFSDALNAAKNKPGVSLLCVTQKPHHTMMVFRNGKAHKNSDLELTRVDVDALRGDEIQKIFLENLEKDHADRVRSNPGLREVLVQCIRGKSKEYALALYLSDKINNLHKEDMEKSLEKRLKAWSKEFHKREKDRFLKKAQRSGKFLRAFGGSTGLNRIKFPSLGNLLKLFRSKKDD